MFRLFDWECPGCSTRFAATINVPQGEKPQKTAEQTCPACDLTALMDRMYLSAPAPYMGEKVCNPKMMGGNFDTMGGARAPTLPKFAPIEEHNKKVGEFLSSKASDLVRYEDADGKKMSAPLAQVPTAVLHEEVKRAFPNAPRAEDLGDHVERPEYSELRGARKRVIARNKKKRQRAAALERGENINFKRDRCEGDPKI